jgi:phage shock protein A
MSNVVKEGRRSLEEKTKALEEKTKALEEKARLDKLVIDKKLAVEILEEENRTHDETIKELENIIEEENHTHNDLVKELEDKIANLEQQMRPQSSPEGLSSQTISESPQDISDDVDERISVGALQELGEKEVEVPSEGSKKKRRSILRSNLY